MNEGVLADLERTADEVRWSGAPADGSTHHVLFSRSGYTDDCKRSTERREDVSLFDCGDVLEVL